MGNLRLFDELITLVPEDAEIINVQVGIFWTVVQTQYGAGMAATAHRWLEDPAEGALIPDAGHLIGMRVHQLAHYYDLPSLTSRALAVAAVSASFPAPDKSALIFESGQAIVRRFVQNRGQKTTIALIGHFHFADALRQEGHELMVFELDQRCGEGDIPASLMPEKIGKADIVAMTSSTLLTHATENIIRFSRPDAYKLIVGPTVPMHPVLLDRGLDAICGNLFEDPEAALRTVGQGGNHKQIPGSTKCVLCNPPLP